MQNSNNHLRFYWPHHFLVLPVLFLLSIFTTIRYVSGASDSYVDIILTITILILAIIVRTYATSNQDRVIRLEVRLRYFQLISKSFDDLEKQLSLPQIIALRFANDNELLSLINRAIEDKLSPKEIKAAISDWQIDNCRI